MSDELKRKKDAIAKVGGVGAALVLAGAAAVALLNQPAQDRPLAGGCCYDPTTGTSRQPLPGLGESEGVCKATRLHPWEWRSPCPNVGTVDVDPTPTYPPEPTDPPEEPTPTASPGPTPSPGVTPTPVPGGQVLVTGVMPATGYVLVLECPPEQCFADVSATAWRLRGPWTVRVERTP